MKQRKFNIDLENKILISAKSYIKLKKYWVAEKYSTWSIIVLVNKVSNIFATFLGTLGSK